MNTHDAQRNPPHTRRLYALLRQTLPGVAFLTFLPMAYDEPALTVPRLIAEWPVLIATLLLATTIGSLLYAFHRAIPYQIIYWLYARWIRHRSPLDLDLDRWKRLAGQGDLENFLKEWASQVHFLYCTAWAAFAALILGELTSWHPTRNRLALLIIATALLLAAAIHHGRYQRWEARVFEESA